MSRELSEAFKAAAYAQETGKVVVSLLTITHDDLEETLRASSDATERVEGSGAGQPVYGTVSRGETYYYIPHQMRLPTEQDRSTPTAQIVLDNVGRELVQLVRSTDTPAQVTIEIVLADDPDTVEVTFPTLDLVGVSYEAGRMTLDLSVDHLSAEPFPAGSFDPSGFRGLFN